MNGKRNSVKKEGSIVKIGPKIRAGSLWKESQKYVPKDSKLRQTQQKSALLPEYTSCAVLKYTGPVCSKIDKLFDH